MVYSYNLEFIQNYVQLVWSEEGESTSSVLRSISVVVDAESTDCADDDVNGIETDVTNVEEDKNEGTIGERLDFSSSFLSLFYFFFHKEREGD